MSNKSETNGEKSPTQVLNSFINAEEDQNKEKSNIEYEREKIENTPFWVIGNNEEGYILTLGKLRVSKKKYPSKEQATEVGLYNDLWDIIFNMIVAIIQMDKEAEKPEGK